MGRGVSILLVAVGGLAGCTAPARYVSKQADGGVVAIPADTDAWPTRYRTHAEELIVKHVGPDFEVVGEGEFVTGQTTARNQQVQRDATFNTTNPFLPASKDTINTTTTTRDVTEYHISYRRRAAAPPSGGAALPAGGPMMPSGPVQPAGGLIPAVGPK